MYGVEAASSGQVGGLAAQVPGGDLYYPQAAAIHNVSTDIQGAPPFTGSPLAISGAGGVQNPVAIGNMAPPATPVGQQHASWSTVLDFHNSVAPWILIAILFLYGWLHVSVRAKAGRVASAAAVL